MRVAVAAFCVFDAMLFSYAAGRGYKLATREQLCFLVAADILSYCEGKQCWLINVDMAIRAFGRAGAAAPLLAAMAGIPKLQPHTAAAPSLP